MIKKALYFYILLINCFFVVQLKAQNKPNILIIVADDCTFSDLPLYGGTNVETPEIDKLASEGMIFNKAYVTMPMCSPSRTELYTGLYPISSGVNWNHAKTKKEVKSIVHYLEKEGYRTGIAGKVHVGPQEVFPFEMVDGIERNSISETADFDLENLRNFITKNKSEPFCMISALVVPHIPWTVGNPSYFNPDELELPEYLADTKDTRKEFANYLAEIKVLDDQVGSILKVLKEENVSENTIVIFTSEQGAQFPFSKWTNYEMGVHTGFIVRWPKKVKGNTRTNALIQYVDVLPTLIEAVGGNIKKKFDGSSFLSILKGEENTHRKYAYFMHNNVPEGPPYPIRSITDGTYHYIRNLKPKNLYLEKHLMTRMPLNKFWSSWIFESTTNQKIMNLVNRYMKRPFEELYFPKSDPNEMKNLAEEISLKKIKKRLSNQLDFWMKQQGDEGIKLDTYEAMNKTKD